MAFVILILCGYIELFPLSGLFVKGIVTTCTQIYWCILHPFCMQFITVLQISVNASWHIISKTTFLRRFCLVKFCQCSCVIILD